jgi:hypothetical protein
MLITGFAPAGTEAVFGGGSCGNGCPGNMVLTILRASDIVALSDGDEPIDKVRNEHARIRAVIVLLSDMIMKNF